MNATTANTKTRLPKLYVVTETDESGEDVARVYVNAKTKTVARDFVVGNRFEVSLIQAKDMGQLASDMSTGKLVIHEAE